MHLPHPPPRASCCCHCQRPPLHGSTFTGGPSAAMLAAKVHRDRARADQTAGSRKESAKRKKVTKKPPKKRRPSTEHAQSFRANRDAAAAIPQSGNELNATRRKRSSVVAIVKKRVEMLHMNVVARELSVVSGRVFFIRCYSVQ